MDLGLHGKRALIAGSSSGIGSAIATSLAAEGVSVVVHGRNADSATQVVKQIEADGGSAVAVLADLGESDQVARVADEACAAFGGIDILVNCAGASDVSHAWFDSPPADWERRYRLTVVYAVQLIQALVPAMRTSGWGRVISIGSVSAQRVTNFHPEYAAAKAALNTLAPGLANELAGSGVTANIVESGVVLTANTRSVMESTARSMGITDTGAVLEQRVADEIWPNLAGRLGHVDDIADMVCFLASERAGYVTGTVVRVDGGRVALA
jgi:NAD(P)-dependent dehydrogenase (short-subunit alcohol dehydrogenase family)